MLSIIEILFILLLMIFTDELIEELVNCPKKIVDVLKDSGIGRGSRKIKFLLESADGQHSFSGFISKKFNFSRELFNWVGL